VPDVIRDPHGSTGGAAPGRRIIETNTFSAPPSARPTNLLEHVAYS